MMLKCILSNYVKINITNDDTRLRSILTTNKAKRYTERSFFYTIKIFTQSHSRPLGVIKGFIRKIPGTYKSRKPNNSTGVDKIHSKGDCINGSVANGRKESILYSFALDQPSGHKIYKEPRVKLLTI